MPPLNLAAVKQAVSAKLRSSLLSTTHAKALHIEPMTEQMAAELGVMPAWAGFKIPYFTPQGKVVKDFYRYRFWPVSKPGSGFASLAEPSKLRYVQPAGSELHVYMPPLLKGVTWADVMKEPRVDVYITEGELKAACVCANGRIMMGLGGVFSWMSKRRHQEFLPILEQFVWKGRVVYLCFDSDAATKPLVQLALSRLALALTARGAIVHEIELPPGSDGGKQGVDDFMLANSPEALDTLVKAAKPVQASLELHRLNEEVALLWSGGAGGNVVRVEDAKIMTPQQFTRAFYKDRAYMEYTLNSKGDPGLPKLKFAAEEWLSWRCRARVNNLTYAPGKPRITHTGDFNMWQDCGVKPVKGDIKPWEDLLKRMLADMTVDRQLWFRRWLAYPLVHPGTKMFSCVLVWSHKGGTGKNLMAEAMIPIYGELNCATIKSRHLTSDFNGWAEGKQFIIGDEITLDDKRHTSGDLKSMLTSRTVRINRKGIESYEVPDCANYYFTSNDPVAIVLDQGERRTFVIHAPEIPVGDEYGRKFMAWMRNGGAAHVAYYLINELDMGDFSPTAEPPDTEAKLDLIANSRSEVDTWAVALKLNPDKYLAPSSASKYAGPSSASATGPFSIYTSDDLLKLYDPEERKRASLRTVGIALDRAGFRKALHNNGRLGNTRSTFWIIRNDNLERAPITSTEAARRYVQERPTQFVPPSQQAAAKKEKVQ